MRTWKSVGEIDAGILERELARELPAGHVLKNCTVRALARRLDRDDVVFELEDGRRCVVHLTWKIETDPRWPRYEFVRAWPDEES